LTHTPGGGLAEIAVEEVRSRMSVRAEDDEEAADLERRLDLANARLKEAQAKLHELELEREEGRFVELADVQKDAADTAARIVGVLRAIAQRTALAVEGALAAEPARRAAVVEALIADEVERAIGELRESKYGGTQ
jgi:hypothetical protein